MNNNILKRLTRQYNFADNLKKMNNQIIVWVLRIVPAAIMLQTLFFKFTGAVESIYIFSQLGLEPIGRYGSGVAELIAGTLLLIPRYSVWGAALALGVMGGAILAHLFVLGIEVMDDGGQLFYMALITAVCSAVILFLNKQFVFDTLKGFLS